MSDWIAQNGTQYEIVLSLITGERLATVDNFVSLNYSKVANDLGSFSVALPSNFDVSLLDKDRVISVWRKPVGGAQALDFRGLILQIFEREEANGAYMPVVYGASLNHLLKRRIVAYAAQTTYTDKTGSADDVMKAVVRENLGALATDSDRIISSNNFSVQADLSLGPSQTRAFAWRNVLTVLRDFSQQSRTNGDEIFFDVKPVTDSQFEFRTYQQQPGSDLREKLTFSREFGNLGWAQYDRNWRDFANLVYGLGDGDGISRAYIQAYVTTAEPAGSDRIEATHDARNEGGTSGLISATAAAMQDVRAVKHFQGEALSVPGSIYGLDWNFGDYVTASFRGRQFECIIRAIAVRLNQSRSEDISALLEAYND
jgi:hypothetical protein